MMYVFDGSFQPKSEIQVQPVQRVQPTLEIPSVNTTEPDAVPRVSSAQRLQDEINLHMQGLQLHSDEPHYNVHQLYRRYFHIDKYDLLFLGIILIVAIMITASIALAIQFSNILETLEIDEIYLNLIRGVSTLVMFLMLIFVCIFIDSLKYLPGSIILFVLMIILVGMSIGLLKMNFFIAAYSIIYTVASVTTAFLIGIKTTINVNRPTKLCIHILGVGGFGFWVMLRITKAYNFRLLYLLGCILATLFMFVLLMTSLYFTVRETNTAMVSTVNAAFTLYLEIAIMFVLSWATSYQVSSSEI